MKQKVIDDAPVTRSVLRKEIQRELKKALSNYPTKAEFREELSRRPTIIQVEMMLEDTKLDIDEKARQYRDEILTRMDQIVGELAQIREDRLFERHEKKELQGHIDDHEGRIKELERQSS